MLAEVAPNKALCEKIYAQGGVDLRNVTEEEIKTRLREEQEEMRRKMEEIERILAVKEERVSVEMVWAAPNDSVNPKRPWDMANIFNPINPENQRDLIDLMNPADKKTPVIPLDLVNTWTPADVEQPNGDKGAGVIGKPGSSQKPDNIQKPDNTGKPDVSGSVPSKKPTLYLSRNR